MLEEKTCKLPSISYNIPMNEFDKLINMKWEDGMPTVPSNSIDLIVTSPPYNVGLGKNRFRDKDKGYESYDDNMPYDEYLNWMDKLFAECYRVLKPSGRIAINIGDGSNGSIMTHVDFSIRMRDKHKFIPITTIVWNKKQIGGSTSWGSYQSPSNPSFPTQFEFIIVMAKETRQHLGDKSKITVSGKDFQRNSRALWEFPPETQMMKLYGHPAAYPEELPRRLIDQLTYEEDVVLDPFSGCYDEKTEVLTKRGWRFFKDISKEDEFLTRNLNGILEYNIPSKIHKYNYSGDLIKIKSRSTDLLVTPDHNMYIITHADFCANRGPQFIKAKDMNCALYRIPCGGKYLPNCGKLDRSQMHLIGLYLSEGYFQKERNNQSDNMIICQNRGKKNDKMIRDIFPLMSYKRSNRKFRVKVGYEFKDFVVKNCGVGKYDKFISHLILNNKHLDALFESMMDGDGCRGKCGSYMGKQYYSMRYYTSSKKLVDSFQELCIKLGYETSCTFRNRPNDLIMGRKNKNGRGCYEINIRRSKNKKIIPQKHISKVHYDGFVYCVTVPNHTLYIRRNGTTSWCGNSGTTCSVAKKMNRHYIGFEMSEKYHNTAIERLAEIPTMKKIEIEGKMVEVPDWLR